MYFCVNIDMDKLSANEGVGALSDVLQLLSFTVVASREMPDGVGNIEDREGNVVGFWEVSE